MESDNNGVLRVVVTFQLFVLEEPLDSHDREGFRCFVLLNPHLQTR